MTLSNAPGEATGTVEHLFPTPVAQFRLRDAEHFNKQIYEAAMHWRRAHGDGPSHVDAWRVHRGWEIGPDFFGQLADVDAVAALQRTIETCVLSFVSNHYLTQEFDLPRIADGCSIEASWATAIRDNALLADEHTHHGAHLVAVYYLRVPPEIDGRDGEAGYLLLRDPRPGMHVIRLAGQRTTMLVRPEEGLLVVMPAYVSHAVRPFWYEGERVSINCNISITGVRVSEA